MAIMEMLRPCEANVVLTLDNKAWEARKRHRDLLDKTLEFRSQKWLQQ